MHRRIILSKFRAAVLTTAVFIFTGCATGGDSADGEAKPASKEDIRQVMLDNGRAIDECYVARKRALPYLRGKLVLDWAVLPTGDVARVKVVEGLDPVLDGCISALVKGWKFPPTTNGKVQKIRYPFQFRSN